MDTSIQLPSDIDAKKEREGTNSSHQGTIHDDTIKHMGGTRGKLSPKENDDIHREPITLTFNKTAFAFKNEECI